jgi:hypothetical protein
MAIPRAWHLDLCGIVPIRSTASTWMVGYFADRYRGLAMLAKPLGHAWADAV